MEGRDDGGDTANELLRLAEEAGKDEIEKITRRCLENGALEELAVCLLRWVEVAEQSGEIYHRVVKRARGVAESSLKSEESIEQLMGGIAVLSAIAGTSSTAFHYRAFIDLLFPKMDSDYHHVRTSASECLAIVPQSQEDWSTLLDQLLRELNVVTNEFINSPTLDSRRLLVLKSKFQARSNAVLRMLSTRYGFSCPVPVVSVVKATILAAPITELTRVALELLETVLTVLPPISCVPVQSEVQEMFSQLLSNDVADGLPAFQAHDEDTKEQIFRSAKAVINSFGPAAHRKLCHPLAALCFETVATQLPVEGKTEEVDENSKKRRKRKRNAKSAETRIVAEKSGVIEQASTKCCVAAIGACRTLICVGYSGLDTAIDEQISESAWGICKLYSEFLALESSVDQELIVELEQAALAAVTVLRGNMRLPAAFPNMIDIFRRGTPTEAARKSYPRAENYDDALAEEESSGEDSEEREERPIEVAATAGGSKSVSFAAKEEARLETSARLPTEALNSNDKQSNESLHTDRAPLEATPVISGGSASRRTANENSEQAKATLTESTIDEVTNGSKNSFSTTSVAELISRPTSSKAKEENENKELKKGRQLPASAKDSEQQKVDSGSDAKEGSDSDDDEDVMEIVSKVDFDAAPDD